MAKINIKFNNTDYNIDESVLAAATAELKSHLSSTMSGSGATINLGGISYNVDSTKLSSATTDFINHLGSISGNGYKVVIGGNEYSIASDKVANVISGLETLFDGLKDNAPKYHLKYKIQDGDYLYTYEGMSTFEDQKHGLKLLYEREAGMPWDEMWKILTEQGINSEDEFFGMNGFSEENFVPVEPCWSVSMANENITGENPIKNEIDGIPVTIIGHRGFYDCDFTSIEIPTTIKTIAYEAFAQSNLTSIIIPPNVETIGSGAFHRCLSLEDFVITADSKLDTIVDSIFTSNMPLTYITFNGTVQQWNAIAKDSWYFGGSVKYVQCSDGTVSL